MAKIIGSPTRYIQGRGELANLAKHAGAIGETMFILVDKFVKPLVMPSIEAGMGDRKFEVVEFGGECSMTEINRVIEVLKEKGGDVVVGIGGGKTHDT
ncbi:MAG: iron-containing alcohol dehydrogenase, partial [Oscillospiraceae bacterium]|nr:iron-containing alcohol dehydrogenase [Oscillospiraceae bacterium]